MASKTVLVTGSSRGIGAAIAEVFAKNGFNVVINYRKNKEKALVLLEKLRSFGTNSIAVQADISDYSECEKMFETIRENFKTVDVLVNNAGFCEKKLFTKISGADWQRMFNINVNGAFNCTKMVLDDMIAAKSGKIINISSILGINGSSCEVHYSASKAALIGFTRALAKEVGPSNVQVNCVCPGVISTDMNADFDDNIMNRLIAMTPMSRIGTPEDVANMVYFFGSENSNFITGQVVSVDGGIFNI